MGNLFEYIKSLSKRPAMRLFGLLLLFLIAIFILVAINLRFHGLLSFLWRAPVVDAVVVAVIGISIWAALKIWSLPKADRQKFFKSAEFGAMGTVAILGAVYIAYASFRNQARMSAEASLNSEAMILYQIEMASPELRCLYDNYGHARYQQCLDTIVSTEENWSRAILYVEESWYVLIASKADEIEWGSAYSDSIEFWREDIGKDPTGLFSYYLVATEGENARARMAEAGVEINNLCENYLRVWNTLARRSANPPRQVPCH